MTFNHLSNQNKIMLTNQAMWGRVSALLIVITLCLTALFATQTQATEPGGVSLGGAAVSLPRYQTNDVFDVNLVSGQISPSLNTIAIGGDKGLSHSISMFANDFTYKGWTGYFDKYNGKAKYTDLGTDLYYKGVMQGNYRIGVMRVSGAVGSAEFLVVQANGSPFLREFGDPKLYFDITNDIPSSYAYLAIGDTRHTLEAINDGQELLWTLPDGTQVKYERVVQNINAFAEGVLTDITYPNGFKITHHGNTGVTTNTGFQLKYDYTAVNTGLESSKENVYFPLSPPVPGDSWYTHYNPEYVRGINNAIEYCDPTLSAACTLTNAWPEVKFTWPGGMPRAFFIGDSVFQVDVTSAGSKTLTTKYHYEAQDLALEYPDLGDIPGNEGGDDTTRGFGVGEKYMARLVGIQPASSTEITTTYRYRNPYEPVSIESCGRDPDSDDPYNSGGMCGVFFYKWLTSTSGEVLSAEGPQGKATYFVNESQPNTSYINRSVWKLPNFSVSRSTRNPGALVEVNETNIGILSFEDSFRNFVTRLIAGPGPDKWYDYDDRGNLETIAMEKGQVDDDGNSIETSVQAHYPQTCSNPKTCNQPEYTIDANGIQTDYEYHAQSGQITKVIHPAVKTDANSTAIRPVTTYSYGDAPMYATYKINSDTDETSTDGIWLLQSKTSCSKGVTCSGDELVITSYKYTTANLLLKEIAVKTSSKTQRTCYAYDNYGNLIGETKPKGTSALTECP